MRGSALRLVVCGVDEAGRGPLAGPVYAAAVILDPARRIRGLADSKLLAAERREVLAGRIKERAIAWAVAYASVEEIDRINILRASLLAMRRFMPLLPAALIVVSVSIGASWALMRTMVSLPYVGMPNILAGEKLVPELLQGDANPAALAEALVTLLRDTSAQRRQIERFREFHHLLRQNAAEKAAEAVLEVLNR